MGNGIVRQPQNGPQNGKIVLSRTGLSKKIVQLEIDLKKSQGNCSSQNEKIQNLTRENERLSGAQKQMQKANLSSYKDNGARKPTTMEREMTCRAIQKKSEGSATDLRLPVPPRCVRALVFDCGTGETKALMYTYTEGDECSISLEEVRLPTEKKGDKRPGVIDHIEKGEWKGVIDEFSNLYIQSATGSKKLDFCIVGASAWARKLYEDPQTTKEKNRLMFELRASGFYPKIFPQCDEAQYELLATIYAFSMGKRANMIGKQHAFGGVLASGGGSCQYTYFCPFQHNFRSLNIEIGNREGINVFVKAVKKDIADGKRHVEVLDEWLSSVTSQINIAVGNIGGLAAATSPTRAERKRISAGVSGASGTTGYRPIEGFVLCISAQYYAAIELCKNLKGCVGTFGNFANKDNMTAEITAAEAIEAAEAYTKQQRDLWLNMPVQQRTEVLNSTHKRKNLKAWAKGLVNVSFCALLWRSYFKPSAVLCFKRDWCIGKQKTMFRNTWSAGWFIDILRMQKGINLAHDYPQMKGVMDRLMLSRELVDQRTTEFRLMHSKVAFYINDMVGSHISEIPNMATTCRTMAVSLGTKTDAWVTELKQKMKDSMHLDPKLSGTEEGILPRLEGWEFRLKKQESLERKLGSIVAQLLLINAPSAGDGSYAPLESEIMRKVRDALRYTFVLATKTYFGGVVAIEKFFQGLGCRIEAKNYWQEPESKELRQTMYMGLNMVVFLPPDPVARHFADSRYPIEVQVHTPESYRLKMNESHALYEDIRTENVIARRQQLVQDAYRLWWDVEIPSDSQNGKRVSFAGYAGTGDSVFEDKRSQYKDFRAHNANNKQGASCTTFCKYCHQGIKAA